MARRSSRGAGRRSPIGRLVVIGASMGGVEALRALFARLPRNIDAAFVVVLHRSGGITVLPEILARASGRTVEEAKDGQPLVTGGVYVAPGGRHTRVDGGRLRVEPGPRENGHRPSIDVLFRSAADSFAERVIGIVLSGALDCGSGGLVEIKRRGGLAIVQEPATALNRQMPESALDAVDADFVVAPPAMGALIARLAAQAPRKKHERHAPPKPSLAGLVCPDCNGPIWNTGDGSYRCRVGHRYTPEFFFKLKEKRVEAALWEALNIMHERTELSRRMAARARENGHDDIALRYEARASDAEEYAAVLRDLVYRTDGIVPIEEEEARRRARRKKAKRNSRRSV